MTGVDESNPHFFANFLCILLLIDTMNACPVCRIHFKSVAQHVAQASFCRDILTKGNIGNRYPTRSSYSATIQGNTNHPHESQDDPFLDVDLHTYPEDDSMGNNVASAVGQTDERIADDLDQYNQTTCEPLPLVTAADVEQIPTKYFSGNFVLTPQTRGYIELLYFADKYAIPKCGWEELCSLLNKLHQVNFDFSDKHPSREQVVSKLRDQFPTAPVETVRVSLENDRVETSTAGGKKKQKKFRDKPQMVSVFRFDLRHQIKSLLAEPLFHDISNLVVNKEDPFGKYFRLMAFWMKFNRATGTAAPMIKLYHRILIPTFLSWFYR
jgi:hypothetical protein